MKIIKKTVSVFLLISLLCPLFSTTSTAINTKQFYFTTQTGECISYYLDNEGNPYRYEFGEKVFLPLPLDHLRVTNENLLAFLNNQKSTITLQTNNAYRKDIYYNSNILTQYTDTLIPVSTNYTLRMRTTNMDADFFDKTITYGFWYKDAADGQWYGRSYSRVNCTSALGVPYSLHSLISRFYFTYIYTENIESFTAEIWLTL